MLEIRKCPFLLQQQWCISLNTDFQVLNLFIPSRKVIDNRIFYLVLFQKEEQKITLLTSILLRGKIKEDLAWLNVMGLFFLLLHKLMLSAPSAHILMAVLGCHCKQQIVWFQGLCRFTLFLKQIKGPLFLVSWSRWYWEGKVELWGLQPVVDIPSSLSEGVLLNFYRSLLVRHRGDAIHINHSWMGKYLKAKGQTRALTQTSL